MFYRTPNESFGEGNKSPKCGSLTAENMYISLPVLNFQRKRYTIFLLNPGFDLEQVIGLWKGA